MEAEDKIKVKVAGKEWASGFFQMTISPLWHFSMIKPYTHNGAKGILTVVSRKLINRDVSERYYFFKGEKLYEYAKLGLFEDRLFLGYFTIAPAGDEWTLFFKNESILPIVFSENFRALYQDSKFEQPN